MTTDIAEARPSSRSELAGWYASLLADQEASGLSVAEYAAEVGVTSATLYNWRRRLGSKRRRHRGEGAGLVRVHVKADVHRPDAAAKALVIRVGGGRSIDVPPGFDAGELARVLEVLESC